MLSTTSVPELKSGSLAHGSPQVPSGGIFAGSGRGYMILRCAAGGLNYATNFRFRTLEGVMPLWGVD